MTSPRLELLTGAPGGCLRHTAMDPMDVSDGLPPPPPTQPPRRPSPAISPSAAPSAVATGKHPAPEPSTSSAASTTGGPGQVPSKRRRGIGIVTPIACTECRKKRAKVSSRHLGSSGPGQREGHSTTRRR